MDGMGRSSEWMGWGGKVNGWDGEENEMGRRGL